MPNDRFRSRTLAIVAGALLLGGALPLAAMAGTPQPAPAKEPVKQTKIVLVTDDGKGEQKVEIDDLGELADGETREVVNAAGGGKVTVTRDGDELVVKSAGGKEIRVPAPGGEEHGMAFVSADGGDVKVIKRIVKKDGEEAGEPMVWMHRGDDGPDGPGCGCHCCGHGGHGGHGGQMRMGHGGPHGEMPAVEHQMVWEGKPADGPGGEREFYVMRHGPGMPGAPGPMIEQVIAGLEASASFRELDPATRDKVLAALREQAAAGPGHRRVEVRVIEEKSGQEEKAVKQEKEKKQ